MRVEDLVIGKEYYLDSSKIDKGIFRGKNKEGSVFYEPTTKTGYIIETNNKNLQQFQKVFLLLENYMENRSQKKNT